LAIQPSIDFIQKLGEMKVNKLVEVILYVDPQPLGLEQKEMHANISQV